MDRQSLLVLLTLFLIPLSSQLNDYHLTSSSYIDDIKSKFTGDLSYQNPEFKPEDYNIPLQNSTVSSISPIPNLSFTLDVECDEYIHYRVIDKDNTRWEPQYTVSVDYKAKVSECKNTKSLADWGVTIDTNAENPFTFNIADLASSEIIFNTKDTNLLYTENLLAFGAILTSNDIYGFGERYHDLKLGDGIYTMWPNDTSGLFLDLGKGGQNTWGSHPMALHKTKGGKFMGVLFNNINAQDVVITTKDDSSVYMEHRTIGGVIDYYIYVGNTPDEVLIHLHEIVGRPMLPPYWSWGFHQCRWGYETWADMKKVTQQLIHNYIPFDSIWGDIDILEDKRIFSWNSDNFADLPRFVDDLHSWNYHFIPIVDVGFAWNETDKYYNQGVKDNAFILSNYTQKHWVSYVWPGNAVFPDFFTQGAVDWWATAMKDYFDILEYDGIWIDMNEPAMITALPNTRGEIWDDDDQFVPEKNKYEYIPYVPGFRAGERTDIRTHSLSENALSVISETNPLLTSYNFKALISLLQAKNTNEGLVRLNKRPFILSRSTTLGSGRFTFHWWGDNSSVYADMKNGISGTFQFQIYGIPMVGDDICGFNQNSNDDLCARWFSLGAFFPFSRNHNSIGNIAQDPLGFGYKSNTFRLSSLSLRMRYSLIRYYYTQLFLISLGKSGSFWKPLFFEYPNDELAYKYTDITAMVGDSLYLIPLFEKSKDVTAFFPNDDYVYYNDLNNIASTYDSSASQGTERLISDEEFSTVFWYLRGGKIIPRQETFSTLIKNTYDLHNSKTEIIVHPDSSHHMASGAIVFDNDSLDTLQTGDYLHITMSFTFDTLLFGIENEFKTPYTKEDLNISVIKFTRMAYLQQAYQIAQIMLFNGDLFHVKISIKDESYTINIENWNIQFDKISSLRFMKLNADETLNFIE